MSILGFFTIEYPITQPLPGKWIGPLGYVAIFFFTILVGSVNVALVGYETVSRFTTDYNRFDDHWYHKFAPGYKPLQICDPVIFTVGQQVSSNVSLFDWQIRSSTRVGNIATGALLPDKYVIYRGETLDRCALTTIRILAQKNQSTISTTMTVTCNFAGDITRLDASLSPSFDAPATDEELFEGEVPERSSFLTVQDLVNQATPTALHRASWDPTNTPWSIKNITGVRINMRFPFCPLYDISCTEGQPNITYKPEEATPDESVSSIMKDYSQVISAAVKIDLGDTRKANNFLLDTTLMNQAISDGLADFIQSENYSLPISSDFGPSRILSPFLCRYQEMRTPGSLIISVFAATSTVVTGAWGVAIVIAAWLVKRAPSRARDNVCQCDRGSFESSRDNLREAGLGNDKGIDEKDSLFLGDG